MKIAGFLIFCSVPFAASQFVPHFRYYTPQEFLDYVDPAPQLSFSLDSLPSFTSAEYKQDSNQPVSLPSFGGSPNVNSRQYTGHFDPSAREPGTVPTFSGAFSKDVESSATVDPLRQPGRAPKFTGSFLKGKEDEPVRFPAIADPSSIPTRLTDAAIESFQGPMTNPAATFLAGTSFETMAAPKCRMVDCAGPVPNDGSASTSASNLRTGTTSACSQVLVPLNGCTGGHGYPMAMLCSVCCECTAPLVSELLKTAKLYQSDINFQ